MNYVELILRSHLILAVVGLGFIFVRKFTRRPQSRMKSSVLLKIGYLVLSISCVAAFAQFDLPDINSVAETMRMGTPHQITPLITQSESVVPVVGTQVGVGEAHAVAQVTDYRIFRFVKIALIGSVVLGIVAFFLEVLKLIWLKRVLRPIRRVGKIHLMTGRAASPFSFSLGAYSYVVMPSSGVLNKTQFSLALKHELQHIRQRDTTWIFLLTLIQKILWLNPIVHQFIKLLRSLQEEACDEKLIVNRRVAVKPYAQVLLEILYQRTTGHQAVLTSSILGRSNGNELKARIQSMADLKNKSHWRGGVLLAIGLLGCIAISVVVAQKVILPEEPEVTTLHSPQGKFLPTPVPQLFISTSDGMIIIRKLPDQPEEYWDVKKITSTVDGKPYMTVKIQHGIVENHVFMGESIKKFVPSDYSEVKDFVEEPISPISVGNMVVAPTEGKPQIDIAGEKFYLGTLKRKTASLESRFGTGRTIKAEPKEKFQYATIYPTEQNVQLAKGTPPPEKNSTVGSEVVKDPKVGPKMYLEPLYVKVNSGGGSATISVTMELSFGNKSELDSALLKRGQIRDAIVISLSGKSYKDIKSRETMETVKKETAYIIRDIVGIKTLKAIELTAFSIYGM